MFDYVYLRDNPIGELEEFWYHAQGCRNWLRVVRDTRSHMISAAVLGAGHVTGAGMSGSSFRLPVGGLIDRPGPDLHVRRQVVRGLCGRHARLGPAGQRRAAGRRSFKYHRPRGILTAGSEEPNALVTLRSGARAEPNTRATTVELYAGLEATSQNRWPNLDFDLLSVNQLLSPIFVAGFYYKTFMWPAKAWEKLYEPLIRRAAGLGALSGQEDPDHYEHDHAFCDLLVVGARAGGSHGGPDGGKGRAARGAG
jgi:sarcosine oxidase subunit alpha